MLSFRLKIKGVYIVFILALASILFSGAMTGLSIASRRSAAKEQSQALKEQGTLKAKERAKKTKLLAGKQKASFLQSGISLTGEGTPQSLIGETYDVGLEDIEQIKKNTGRGVSNIWSKARSGMIGDLSKFALNVGMTGLSMGAASGIESGGGIAIGGGRTTYGAANVPIGFPPV